MNMKNKDVYPDMTYADNMPRKDHEKYAGQWVVIVDNEIVWHNKSARYLRKQVEKYNKQNITPIIFRVSDGSDWLLC